MGWEKFTIMTILQSLRANAKEIVICDDVKKLTKNPEIYFPRKVVNLKTGDSKR